ncbi:MAG: hypothetical protein HQ581_17015, partial [Planctomycetes bacterium]|nr:hypothetical protein [Planctomycetota bacterium]
HTAGPLAVEVVNTLYLGRGPLIGLDHAPGFDESVVLRLSHCTLRGPGALAECRQGQRTDAPGEIEVRAIGCVFALPDTSALLVFTGAEHPQRLLDRFHWEGEGSLLAPGPAVARWHHSAGGVVTELDDASVDISGLVRGEVEFVGGPFEGPQSSRLTGQWQAPLHSTERPGIDPAKLPWPERPEPPGPSPR